MRVTIGLHRKRSGDVRFPLVAQIGRHCYLVRQINDKAELAIRKIGSDTNVGQDIFQI
jgi:hypothetical protein